MRRVVTLDYETRSELDLRSVGAYKYARDPSTEIICVAWCIDDEPVKIFFPSLEEISSATADELIEDLTQSGTLIEAHNAFFEFCITRFVLPRYSPIGEKLLRLTFKDFDCTAARAASLAIPRNLEGAAQVMGLKNQKDMKGNRLVKKYMKPRSAWKKWKAEGAKGPEPKKYFEDFFELEAIGDYCIQDVETERELSKVVPHLTEFERKVWIVNQEMNYSGITVDVSTAKTIIKLYRKQISKLEEELKELTRSKVTTVGQRDKIVNYLRHDLGLEIPGLASKVVSDYLERENLDPKARRILEIRQEASKSSIKKYPALITRAYQDDKIRDLALYHGASTGRETGTGFQVHNLPRGTIKVSTNFAIEVINDFKDLEEINFFAGPPMEVFSSCVRGMITASPGYQIVSADLNAIEARIVNWLFNNERLLEAFRRGDDAYKLMASLIFKKGVEEISDFERFVGKTVVLGCGYGMGADKFLKQLQQYGIKDANLELAKIAVKTFRESNSQIPRGWKLLEAAAFKAVQTPGKDYSVFGCSFVVEGKFLKLKLPSGRYLHYFNPHLEKIKTPWGEPGLKLYYYGVDSQSKKWKRTATYGGHLTENICQGIARDIMVSGILKARAKGFRYLFQVHDEANTEALIGTLNEHDLIECLTSIPSWGQGLPVTASGWSGPRYKK